jgi:signal transduction histidine kinase
MGESSRFLRRTVAGFAAVISLLAGGVVFAVHRLDRVASERMAEIRVQEINITAVERLRWSAELVVSAGRGYLVSGGPELLARLQRGSREFRANLEQLKESSLTPAGLSLLAEVERSATEFKRQQKELVAARAHEQDGDSLARRFETELQPRRRGLARALDRLVEQKSARLAESYAQAARDRRRLMASTWALVGSLVILALAIAGLFARKLTRAYRMEAEAHGAAQKALSARDELLGIVAHDLRNPLGAITLKAAAMRMQAEAESARKQAGSIENIAIRMDYIIRSLLDVASVEAGQFSIKPAPHRVEGLLQETADLFGTVAASKAIGFDLDVSDPDLAIHADRDRVLQVLSNLVGNAIKFTPRGGHVSLTVEGGEKLVRFSVADTGPGIDAQYGRRIFERFWKLEQIGSKGTGLGLFIAKQIVEAHQGRIWVESHPGHGATFNFELPAARPEATAAHAAAAPGALGRREAHGGPADHRR